MSRSTIPHPSLSCSTDFRNQPLHVMKFGGTSVGSADALDRMAAIVAAATADRRVVLVVSAASGVTDDLVRATATATDNASAIAGWIDRLAGRHRMLAREILTDPAAHLQYEAVLCTRLTDLHQMLNTIAACGDTPARRDAVLATGERLLAPLAALRLEQAGLRSRATDAAQLIRTDATHGEATVDRSATTRQIRRWYRNLADGTVPVVTGFLGSTADGTTTTLGRGGSDYSAALLAQALQADMMERWTDVDGLYTDNPHRNDNAERLEEIMLEQAAAWNRTGRLGMHPKALDPLVEAGIPIRVRCTHAPATPGTLALPVHPPAEANTACP